MKNWERTHSDSPLPSNDRGDTAKRSHKPPNKIRGDTQTDIQIEADTQTDKLISQDSFHFFQNEENKLKMTTQHDCLTHATQETQPHSHHTGDPASLAPYRRPSLTRTTQETQPHSHHTGDPASLTPHRRPSLTRTTQETQTPEPEQMGE
jgi:hypothetical protein